VLILSIYSGVEGLQWSRICTEIENDKCHSVGRCTSDYFWVFLCSLTLWHCIIVYLGVHILTKSRLIPQDYVNPASTLGIYIFSLQLLIIIPVAIHLLEDTNYGIMFICALAVTAHISGVLALAFIPVLRSAYRLFNEAELALENVLLETRKWIRCNVNQSGNNNTASIQDLRKNWLGSIRQVLKVEPESEVNDLQVQNRRLQARLKSCKVELLGLKRRLSRYESHRSHGAHSQRDDSKQMDVPPPVPLLVLDEDAHKTIKVAGAQPTDRNRADSRDIKISHPFDSKTHDSKAGSVSTENIEMHAKYDPSNHEVGSALKTRPSRERKYKYLQGSLRSCRAQSLHKNNSKSEVHFKDDSGVD